jgi:4-diphosphocytidyl-2-C-methyl-D-erythritol kinase
LTIALPARAKLNLDLAVLRRRDDGFHDVRTPLQAIDLHDLVILGKARQTTLTTSGLNVMTAANNSCLTAHAALERAAERELPARIHLHKRIPAGSGMGGASSDAATTLKGLVTLHRLHIDLEPIAAKVGADVPFFLAGGTAVAEGRGDRLTPLDTQAAWFALAWPEVELRTPDVYRAWDETPGEPPNQLANAAFRVEPRLREFAESLGPGWQMTGSGSAFFKRCATEREAIEAASALGCWTSVAQGVGAWS